LTTSSIVILSAPAIAGASFLVVALESPTIMDAAMAGTRSEPETTTDRKPARHPERV